MFATSGPLEDELAGEDGALLHPEAISPASAIAMIKPLKRRAFIFLLEGGSPAGQDLALMESRINPS